MDCIRDLGPPDSWAKGRTALFLDLDGTLAEIAPRPDDVRPRPERSALLRRVGERLEGRLAVISGRTLQDVDRILEGAVPAVAAVHGLVRRRADGQLSTPPPPPGLEAVKRACQDLARTHSGLLVEDKGISVALHYRLAPMLGALAASEADRLAREHGLKLQLGDMVSELRADEGDKGTAVRAFMAEPPFQGATPIFVGDDLTDEDGFAAVAELGGIGVLAGPMRATLATRRLDGVGAVCAWLEAGLMENARP
ncbi:MAG: trehalose-phosphatase [Caulobacteraceae bacterium]